MNYISTLRDFIIFKIGMQYKTLTCWLRMKLPVRTWSTCIVLNIVHHPRFWNRFNWRYTNLEVTAVFATAKTGCPYRLAFSRSHVLRACCLGALKTLSLYYRRWQNNKLLAAATSERTHPWTPHVSRRKRKTDFRKMARPSFHPPKPHEMALTNAQA